MHIATISPQCVSLCGHFAGYRYAPWSWRSLCPSYKMTVLSAAGKSWPKFSKQLKWFGTIVVVLHPRRHVVFSCCQRLWFWKWGPAWGSQTGQEWQGPCTANVWAGISCWKPSPSLVTCSVPFLVAWELQLLRYNWSRKMLPTENWAVFSAYRTVGLENVFPMLLNWMSVKQWVCQLSLDCSCLPKEAHSSRTAWPCEANALNAKKDSTGSSKN